MKPLATRRPHADNGVGTNIGVGVGPRAGDGIIGEGQPAPPHQLRGLRERCKLPSGVRGRAPAAEGFSCILTRQIAFPGISVRFAHSLHGQVLYFSRGIHINIPHINSWGVKSPCIPPLLTPVHAETR